MKECSRVERDAQSGPPVRAAAAIVLRSGEGGPWLLVSHRFPDAHLPDLWEFPGGKIHPGEAPEACALREVHEETGVSAEVLERIARRTFSYPERVVDIEFFLCRYLHGVPGPWGCQAVRWVRPERLELYPFPLANGPILDFLRGGSWIPGLPRA